MDRKFSLSRPDILLIGALLGAALLLVGIPNRSDNDELVVACYTIDGLHRELPLDVDTVIGLPGPLGESIIEISQGRARMLSSPCPNKICIHMGAISQARESIVCIPNRVHVQIRAKKQDVDSITY